MKPLGQDHVQQGHQEQGVAAGADGVVLAGVRGGLGAAGVEQHHAAATLADGPQAFAHAGRGEDAAVTGERIGAQHQQEVGAVDVRDGQQQRMPEHLGGGVVVGQLVSAGRAEAVAGPQRFQERPGCQEGAAVVHAGVALEGGDAVRAVFGLHLA